MGVDKSRVLTLSHGAGGAKMHRSLSKCWLVSHTTHGAGHSNRESSSWISLHPCPSPIPDSYFTQVPVLGSALRRTQAKTPAQGGWLSPWSVGRGKFRSACETNPSQLQGSTPTDREVSRRYVRYTPNSGKEDGGQLLLFKIIILCMKTSSFPKALQ